MPGVVQLFGFLAVVGLVVGIVVVSAAYLALVVYQWATGARRPAFARPPYPSDTDTESQRTQVIHRR